MTMRTVSKRAPRPLDGARLEELAVAYVARFSTTRAKLETYLQRKVRERGWADESEPQVAALAERMVAAGYVDDAVYARAKSGSLLRRGFGGRRVAQALQSAGISEGLREDMRPGEGAERRAAFAMVRKRRFGPFGAEPPDPARREKQLAAMLRAGHPLDKARQLVNAPSVEAAEEWVAEPDEDESCE